MLTTSIELLWLVFSFGLHAVTIKLVDVIFLSNEWQSNITENKNTSGEESPQKTHIYEADWLIYLRSFSACVCCALYRAVSWCSFEDDLTKTTRFPKKAANKTKLWVLALIHRFEHKYTDFGVCEWKRKIAYKFASIEKISLFLCGRNFLWQQTLYGPECLKSFQRTRKYWLKMALGPKDARRHKIFVCSKVERIQCNRARCERWEGWSVRAGLLQHKR